MVLIPLLFKISENLLQSKLFETSRKVPQDVLKGLVSNKFLKILLSNKTPANFWTEQLKITLIIQILCVRHFKFVQK